MCKRTGASINREYDGTRPETLRQIEVMGMGVAFLPARNLYQALAQLIRARMVENFSDVVTPIFDRGQQGLLPARSAGAEKLAYRRAKARMGAAALEARALNPHEELP